MKKSVVLIGVGEMGAVFARGFLKLGHPVVPVTRGAILTNVEQSVPDPEAVIVAVGEKDLNAVLESVPLNWHERLVFLQNELLPGDWRVHQIHHPTVISVWFEKKAGQDTKVLIPSPVYGPKAELVKSALEALSIPVNILKSEEDLLRELVLKNLYILTVNIAGLEVGGTVGELWAEHNELARAVAGDVLDIQFALIRKNLDRDQLINGMVAAFNGDLAHKCMGRSAPARLQRALSQAKELGLRVEKLQHIQQVQNSKA